MKVKCPAAGCARVVEESSLCERCGVCSLCCYCGCVTHDANHCYQAERRRRRAAIKAALLPLIQQAEARDERIDFTALAAYFRCGKSTLRQMRVELAETGLCRPGSNHAESIPRDLDRRIEAVRNARLRKWKSREARNPPPLSTAELEEVLPT